jgi:dihydropteroate synthase
LRAEIARTLASGATPKTASQADADSVVLDANVLDSVVLDSVVLDSVVLDSVVLDSVVLDALHGLALAVEALDADLLGMLTTTLYTHGGHVLSSSYPTPASATTAIIAGSLSSLDRAAATLMGADATLDAGAMRAAMQLGAELSFVLEAVGRGRYVAPTLTLGDGQCRRQWRWGERTYVMGIVNCTPDSFSGDGLLNTPVDQQGQGRGSPTRLDADQHPPTALAVEQARRFLEQGADIIDVGGESTRPGGEPVDAATELSRVLPVIEALCASDAPPLISIDTYKAEVARAALDAGAVMVNDVWGLRRDPEMAPLIAERGVPVVIMHNRSKPDEAALADLGGRYIGSRYDNLLADILRELDDQVEAAVAAGIAKAQILIDPGIGFGKTVSQNLALLNHVDQLRSLGLPILLGSSRKSFIGYTLDLPQDQRVEGTAATLAVGIARGGVDVVRVHDVQAMARVTRMADAIIRAH